MTENKKKILYLTWGENIVDYGIFESQVFQKLVYLSNAGDYQFYLCAGVPVGKKYLKERRAYLKGLEKIKSRLSIEGVDFFYRRIIKISPHFHAQWWALWTYSLPHIFFLRSLIKQKEISIVHCRSYHAALLAIMTRAVFRLNFKVVFDTRGLVPEEGVLIGAYGEGSLSYRVWKKTEKFLLRKADAVVNVSSTLTDHVRTICDGSNILTIHTCVDTAIFKPNELKRNEVGRSLGICDRDKVLVYCGSLGEKGWHSPGLLAEVFSSFKIHFGAAKLLVITRSDSRVISRSFANQGLVRDDYLIVRGNTLQEVSSFLQRGDYAAFPYREISGNTEADVSRTVIAIKTGEYLSCGLPVIVNRVVGAASSLVEKYGVGLVFESHDVHSIGSRLDEIESNYKEVSITCQRVAEEHFSYAKNVKRYLDIYDTITENN